MHGTDLILNGEIILEGAVLPHEYCLWMGEGCFSARMVREALAQFSGDVTVRVNSGGGDPFEGEAVRAALADHAGEVTVIVGGVAASAASLMIMSAARIEIGAGSFIMVHGPSSCICGTAGDHRRESDRLDTLSRTYAAVYAARSGQDEAAVLALMMSGEDAWYGGEDAVIAGYADAVRDTGQPTVTQAQAQSMFNTVQTQMARCIDASSDAGTPPAGRPTAHAGQPQAAMAATEEVPMDPEELTAGQTPPTPTPPADPAPAAPTTTMQAAPDTSAAERRGAEAERARQRDIRQMAQPFMASGQLTAAQVETVIDEGIPAASAGNRFLAVMAAGEAPVSPPARITRDATETRMEGMIQAMMRNYEGPGAEYRGLRLRGLAMELGGNRGYSDADRVMAGMRSTTMMGGATGVSDFAYVTTEVMNRSLIAEYDRRVSNWDIVTGAPQQASDFRELHAVRFGGDFQLKTVKENGEYHEATLDDEGEGLKVERRGRRISLTFEAVINDDMGAFNRIPREFAIAARLMEASMVWTIIRSNAVLKSDSKTLFHADHKNLASSGGAIAVATVAAARKAMWEQTAFGSKDKEDFLMLSPDLLIVPPALETTALQFVAGITPAKQSDTNPYRETLTPHVTPHLGASAGGSDAAWYLGSSDLPPVSVAYLDGYESPTVQTIEGMNPDKVTMDARHIFGAAASEFRGVWKNPGA